MIEEDAGIAWAGELSGGYGGDDEAADDEEEVDAQGSVIEEAHEVGGAVFELDAMEMTEDDEDGGEAAADLDAGDVTGLGWPCGLQGADPLHHCINMSADPGWCSEHVHRRIGLAEVCGNLPGRDGTGIS